MVFCSKSRWVDNMWIIYLPLIIYLNRAKCLKVSPFEIASCLVQIEFQWECQFSGYNIKPCWEWQLCGCRIECHWKSVVGVQNWISWKILIVWLKNWISMVTSVFWVQNATLLRISADWVQNWIPLKVYFEDIFPHTFKSPFK